MSNKPKAKTNITKITAKPREKSAKDAKNTAKTTASAVDATKTTAQKPAKPPKSQPVRKVKGPKIEKPLREIFILARPFVALGRYLRDSWREIRQVRWPNRKATWKMTVAVLVYCAIFVAFITLLDTFFTFIFKLLLGN